MERKIYFLLIKTKKLLFRLFIKPKTAGFTFSLLGGIFLTISLELILRLLDNLNNNVFGHTQKIGVLFFVSSVLFLISAFFMEDFQDYLKDKKKENENTEERIYMFDKWSQKSIFITISFCNLFVLFFIIYYLKWLN